MVVESAEIGLKTVIKVCRQEEKNKFGSLKLVLLIKITFHVNIKFLILVFRLLTGLSTIFWHLSTGLSTVRPTPNPSAREGDYMRVGAGSARPNMLQNYRLHGFTQIKILII